MEGVYKMSKLNKFCEKYEVPIWQAIVSLWFFVEYLCNKEVASLFGDGVFWAVFAVFEFIRVKMKSKNEPKKKSK